MSYQPEGKKLDRDNPPQGGSGVPPVRLPFTGVAIKGMILKSHKEVIDGQEVTVIDELELDGVSFVTQED